MNQSTVIVAGALALLLLHIAQQGRLGIYLAILGFGNQPGPTGQLPSLSIPQTLPSTSTYFGPM